MSDDPRGVEARRLTTPLLDRGFLRSTAPADADEILRLAHERGLAGPPDETQWAPSSPTPSGKRQKDPSPGQPSVSLILARGGTSLRQAIARMHNPSESYVRQMIDEYIRTQQITPRSSACMTRQSRIARPCWRNPKSARHETKLQEGTRSSVNKSGRYCRRA